MYYIGKTTGHPEECIKLGTFLAGTTSSANAAMHKGGGSTDSTLSANGAAKRGHYAVPHYPQMLPSVKNGDNTGTTLSANAAVQETGTLPVAHYPQMPPCVKNMDITGTTLSANATMCTFIAVT